MVEAVPQVQARLPWVQARRVKEEGMNSIEVFVKSLGAATAGDMSPEKGRVVRAKWLVEEMKVENVKDAVDQKKLEPDAVQFVGSVAVLVAAIESGDEDAAKLTPAMLARLEDAYVWSLPTSRLTPEQKRQAADWCRRCGNEELANEIEKNVEEAE